MDITRFARITDAIDTAGGLLLWAAYVEEVGCVLRCYFVKNRLVILQSWPTSDGIEVFLSPASASLDEAIRWVTQDEAANRC